MPVEIIIGIQIIDYQVTNNKQLHFYNTFHNLQQIIKIPDILSDFVGLCMEFVGF